MSRAALAKLPATRFLVPPLIPSYGPVTVWADEACTVKKGVITQAELMARDLPDWREDDLPPETALTMRPNRKRGQSPFARHIKASALITAAQKKARRGAGQPVVLVPRELYADISVPRVARWNGRD